MWQSLVFGRMINMMIYGSVWTDRDSISYVEKRCCNQLCTRRSVNFDKLELCLDSDACVAAIRVAGEKASRKEMGTLVSVASRGNNTSRTPEAIVEGFCYCDHERVLLITKWASKYL